VKGHGKNQWSKEPLRLAERTMPITCRKAEDKVGYQSCKNTLIGIDCWKDHIADCAARFFRDRRCDSRELISLEEGSIGSIGSWVGVIMSGKNQTSYAVMID